MTRPLAIVGAGRHGRNVLELTQRAGDRAVAGFLDDTKEPGTTVLGASVLGGFGRMDDPTFVAAHAWFIALGSGAIRKHLGDRLLAAGAEVVRAIHPLADISPNAEIGVGVYIAAFCIVRSQCRIGAWTLMEGGMQVGSDCRIGDAVSFGAGCILAGGASVGSHSFVGAGTIISNEIRVGERCIIGAQSAVIRHVPDGSRAHGVPVRVVDQAGEG